MSEALTQRIRDWSAFDSVQQVFTDGYFKNTTAAGSAIFVAGEIMRDIQTAITEAESAAYQRGVEDGEKRERAACAEIAKTYEAWGKDAPEWAVAIANAIESRTQKTPREGGA
jgi:hypothetical protein